MKPLLARASARSRVIRVRFGRSWRGSALLVASIACPAPADVPKRAPNPEHSPTGKVIDRAKGSEEEPVEVVVQGPPRHPQAAPKDPAVSASVVARERLAAAGARAADVLRSEAGVEITEGGGLGAPATASLRGATAGETPVYVGGVRVNDEVAGAADLGTIPLWLVDRIEVYRSNAPLEADRLGIGGAIFFEPRRPDRPGSGVGALAGSFGTRAGWAYASSGPRTPALLVGLRGEAADNDYEFFDDRGTLFVPNDGVRRRRTNADASLFDAWVLGRTRAGAGHVDLLVNHVARDQGAPKLALVPSRAGRVDFVRTLGAVKTQVPLGDGSALDAQTSLVAARSTVDDPLYELALNAARTEARGERLGQRVALRWAATDRVVLRPAVDLGVEQLGRFDGDASSDRTTPALVARRVSTRLATAVEVRVVGPFAVRPLVSIECHATSTPGTKTDGCAQGPTGRFTGLVGDGSWNVYASAGRYARVPTLGELYGMSPVVHGNPRLRPEKGWTGEVGARWVGRRRSEIRPPWIDVAAFSRWASDLVSFLRSPQGYLVPVNRDTAHVHGVELDATVGFLAHFAARLSVTALDPRDTTPNRPTGNDVLPFHSRLIVAPRLDAESALTSSFIQRVSGALVYVYESSRFGDAAGLAVVPAQASLDAEAAAAGLDGHLTARLRVANILDAPRFDVVGFPLPGRTAFFSMEATW